MSTYRNYSNYNNNNNNNNKKSNRRHGNSFNNSLQIASVIGAGSNKIKKKIRDTERLLTKKKDTLPDTVKIEMERKLDALKLELANAKIRTKATKNAKKYHMVRFFERKKALKLYKKISSELEKNPENPDLSEKLLQASIDLCYVVNFPKTEKYISLYPSNKTTENSENLTTLKRKTYRDQIAKEYKQGTLAVSLDDILKGKRLDKDIIGTLHVDSASNVQENITENEDNEEDDFFE
ncbi:Efg1p SCDLUD_004853 [Saccharomycodes ludwigii]|uniref:Efg1p n=1 Tax=Saccharomycodes ludwigii TaxID=36035 RepID=UPI001E821316|nr:hypothetical protein SCDLUD_004853 [Saccharomycodes ludwigii]KAH3899410.1 hypothetical protein SCDLUD_004853 [Saccharomycodes ludwigii]